MKRRHVSVLGLLCAVVWLLCASSALAAQARYSDTQTIPVPPASAFSGNGGGDGWAVALSSTQVFNVFHHNSSSLQVACHEQSDASNCWSTDPETITDNSGNNFATSGHPGMYLDQSTGKLYVYATRTSDQTGGVVCVDTTQAATNTDPFCGFTALTDVGDAASGISNVSMPMQVGTKLYAFNYFNGGTAGGGAGTENELLCFDLNTDAACTGQPYAVNITPSGDTGPGTVSVSTFPEPAVAAIGSELIIPITVDGTDELACFNASTQAGCAGSWPATSNVNGYPGSNGAPFPMLDSTGKLTGFCLPAGSDPCFNLDGSSATTPANMASVISGSSAWDGPGAVVGPRVYVPVPSGILCFDYSQDSACANFPFVPQNTYLVYTVNPDPQRPTCLWMNSDAGGGSESGQIQNFDAYTGGPCGQGPIRALASQFVAPSPACTPASYDSIQVLQPAPGSYTSGTVQFEDGDGNPIAGIPTESLDSNGSLSLSGLNLNTSTGLPQFLITLNGASGTTAVVVKLIWSGDYNTKCTPPGGKVTLLKDTLTAGHVDVSGSTASVPLACNGNTTTGCDATLTLETTNPADTGNIVTVGQAGATLSTGQSKTVKITLNTEGKRLLAKRGSLETTLIVTQSAKRVARKIVEFRPT